MRLLDLFCGAGGAAMGYHRAGFEVVGVDIKPMPHYPFAFVQADALEYCAEHGREFDVIHASPPCQHYSAMLNCRPGKSDQHPDLVGATRAILEQTQKPYVIENVMGAPLFYPIMLCGIFFGLKVYRHRLFECSWFMLQPSHIPHNDNCRARQGISKRGFITVAGNGGYGCGLGGFDYARRAMGIDWMNRAELSQAIPPAYTEWIGKQLISALENIHA